MRDADKGDLDVLESAVVIELQGGELPGTEFGVDSHDAVNFFAGITVTFKADLGREELDLRRQFGRRGLLGRGRLLRRQEKQTSERQRSYRRGTHETIVTGLVARARSSGAERRNREGARRVARKAARSGRNGAQKSP